MKIKINNLHFQCIIGILPFERKSEQVVIINLSFKYQFKNNIFINYADIVNYIEESMKNEKFLLIEDALLFMKKGLNSKYNIKKLKLGITKPDIMKNCDVSVQFNNLNILYKYSKN